MTADHKLLLTYRYCLSIYRLISCIWRTMYTPHIIIKTDFKKHLQRGRIYMDFANYMNSLERNVCLLFEIQKSKASYSNGNVLISSYLQMRQRLFVLPLCSDRKRVTSSSVSIRNCDLSLVIKRAEACRWPLTNTWCRKVKKNWTLSPPSHLSSWFCASLFLCTNSYQCLYRVSK